MILLKLLLAKSVLQLVAAALIVVASIGWALWRRLRYRLYERRRHRITGKHAEQRRLMVVLTNRKGERLLTCDVPLTEAIVAAGFYPDGRVSEWRSGDGVNVKTYLPPISNRFARTPANG